MVDGMPDLDRPGNDAYVPYTYRLDVIALPLPPTIRHKLQVAGFRTTGDLQGVQPLDLARGGFGFLFSVIVRDQPWVLFTMHIHVLIRFILK